MKVHLIDEKARVPTRGSDLAAGYDLYSTESHTLQQFDRVAVGTGITVGIEPGWYGRIAPRSGLAAKHGIDVLAGVIDADYRGEVLVVLINLGKLRYDISVGDRIAQIIFEPCWYGCLEFSSLSDSERGSSGLGSTGR